MQRAIILSILALAATTSLATKSPVEKVVHLIEDLKAQIEQDAKVEQMAYDKYACWCEKTTARTAASINVGRASIRALGQKILSLKGLVATRSSEIAKLAQDISDAQEAVKEATALREEENTKYTADTTEQKEAIAAMEKAVIVLNGGAKQGDFLQAETVTASRAAVKSAIQAMPNFATLKPEQMEQITAFVQSNEKYAPQSLTINGILKDMYDTFTADLEQTTQDEATANKVYEALMATKAAAIKSDEEEKATRESEKAEAEQQLADATQDYDDTTAQKEADETLFENTKESCEEKHSQWETRKTLRAEELTGINEGLAILTSDDARELFASSIKAGKETGMDTSKNTGFDMDFLQVNSDSSAPAAGAFKAIRSANRKAHSLRLAVIAMQIKSAKVGHFEKILMQIETTIQTLKNEGTADIEKRDECKSEFLEIESTVKDETWNVKVNNAQIDKLERLIAKHEDEKAQTIQNIADVNQTMADMEAQRTAEHQAFNNSKNEDTAAIKLLVSARKALSKFYGNNDIDMGEIQGSVKGSFLQDPEFAVSADQAPDVDFSGKGSHKQESKGIVSLLTYIIEDLNDEISNGMSNEEAQQLAYEKALASALALRKDLRERKTNLAAAIGRRTEDKDDETTKRNENAADLAAELEYKGKIKPDCDWIIGAFTERAEKRAAEMEGLVSAKEYLAGMKPASLLQAQTFDDAALSKISFNGLR